ncbi:MAG TPA: prenyltransferase/squalene oxidase repeat-containing protein [Bryobacteraceae bacterium]|nr:prenyltransferase/squalene oxidase repeat-containing protein [Bryobacteraceae bacterium]
MNGTAISRRGLLLGATGMIAAQPSKVERSITDYLESLARPGGGYGWEPDSHSHLTPSFAVLGCYRLLKREAPRKQALGAFIREHYPMPAARHKDRPLRRFDYEQIQSLLWLGEDVSGLRKEVEQWTGPSEFTPRYELGGNPVFQHEVMALLCRRLLGMRQAVPEWKSYILARRRANGSFNTTPAADGSDGHVMNTWWGLEALDALGENPAAGTADWVAACQLAGGGFTYAPKPQLAGVDNVCYTWSAVRALKQLGKQPGNREACARYLQSLRNADGGFGDRPGRLSNPVATFQALDALAALGAEAKPSRTAPARPRALPSGLSVFTMQIEAPGGGSPADAVEMARGLRIHLWGAKNAPAGWIARCQEIAGRRKVPVRFFVANEEYGTYVSLPGLGTYSHLSDIIAPPDSDFGRSMADPKKPVPWNVFRDERVAALRRAQGANVWQFNENEEFTRVLLDEAVERGTYIAVSSFHFGNENFLNTQPYLMRYQDVLPFVGLQDSHAKEPWWWGDKLAGFRTVFLAKEPTWEAATEALRENRVMAIRHDEVTGFKTLLGGGTPAVRRMVMEHEREWRWWGGTPDGILRPHASMVAVRPGDRFEEARPERGVAIRVRCWRRNTNMGAPAEAITELASLHVDGKPVEAEPVEIRNDRKAMSDCYYKALLPDLPPGKHSAKAEIRVIATGKVAPLSVEI